ncbi:MAG: hypothetical protein JWQ40_71 [Segetibacter sp.]|nr:hypothetical protein [Segetibacter sp.]
MKKFLFYSALFITLASGCRKIEEDGQIVYVPAGGGTTPVTGQTVTLSGRIDKDTVLRKGNEYILKGLVYMVNNATMTIEPGVTVKGSYIGNDVGALIITRGAKINASGTPDAPIVFTSNSPNPRSGDWGGLVLLGKASVNASFSGANTIEVEGGINNSFNDGIGGGAAAVNEDDSSGVLRYVRIEFAGYAYQPDKEINSLTMAAVGRKTVIDHVQVYYAKDDAFEWFGGTVNASHLIAYKTQDDDFDTDNGYSGKVQFGIIIRDSLIADISNSEAFESDNNSSGSTASPKTTAVFSNITAVGPKATLNNNGSSLFLAGAHIRRNTGISIYNSIFLGWPTGIFIDASTGTAVDKNIDDSTIRIRNSVIAGCPVPIRYRANATATPTTDATLLQWFTNPYHGNTIFTTVEEARLIQPFNYGAVDITPFGNSPLVSGAKFTDTKLEGFTNVTFRGALAPAGKDATWWKGWTRF